MDGPTSEGSVVDGSMSSVLMIVGVGDGDEGGYSCTVSNSNGLTSTSNTAMLTVGK